MTDEKKKGSGIELSRESRVAIPLLTFDNYLFRVVI